MVLTVVYALTFVSDLATKGCLHIVGDDIYGYTIVVDVVGLVSWLFSLLVVYRERVLVVTHRPHGLTLTFFWMVSVVVMCLELVSLKSTSGWWWRLQTRADTADLVVFSVRGLVLCVLVVMSVFRPLCCPGHRHTYSLLINADSAAVDVHTTEDAANVSDERKVKEGDFVKTRTTSTFAGIWSKIRRLFPYIWPKGMYVCVYVHNCIMGCPDWQVASFTCIVVQVILCCSCVWWCVS